MEKACNRFLKMTSKVFGRTTRPRFYASVPKKKCTGEITSLTGSSPHEELNRPEGRFGAKRATPTVG